MNIAEALGLAVDLKNQHGLSDWIIDLDRSKRRFGYCSHYEKKLSLSKYLVELNDYVVVRNTILHEIAHALVGPENGHNEIWRQKALSIGCNGKRCHNAVTPEATYLGECPKCKYQIKAFRKRRKRTYHKTCVESSGFEVGAIIWRKVK